MGRSDPDHFSGAEADYDSLSLMDYDLSFDRKSAIALVACLALLCVLITIAGYLIGSRPSTSPASPVPAATQPIRRESAPASASEIPLIPSGGAVTPSNTAPGGGGASANPSVATAPFVLQFGAFRERERAEDLVKRLKDESIKSDVSQQQDPTGVSLYVVRGGSYSTMQEASNAAQSIHAQTGETVLIRRGNRL